CRRTVLRIFNRKIGDVDGRLLGNDPAFLAGGLLLVPADKIDALHECAVLIGKYLQYLPALTLVAACQHDDLIAFFDFQLRHYSTSGASEMIFICWRARNSRGTGPKIRVPIGSLLLLISTAALRSK